MADLCDITDLETFAACIEGKVGGQEISVNTFWLM